MEHGIVYDASTTLTIRSGVGDGAGVDVGSGVDVGGRLVTVDVAVGTGVGDKLGVVDVAAATGVGDTVRPFKCCWKPKALATKTSARSTAAARENPCRFIVSSGRERRSP